MTSDHPLGVLWPLMDPRRGLLLGALHHGGVGVQRLALATLVAAFEAPGAMWSMVAHVVHLCHDGRQIVIQPAQAIRL